MAIYSLAQRTTVGSTSTAAFTLVTTAADRAALLEWGVFMATATTSIYALGRPATVGTTATAFVAALAEDTSATTANSGGVLTWGTSPTNATNELRRWASPATIGTGVIWTFPRGLIVPISANLCLQNRNVAGVVDTYFVIDE